MQKQLLLCGLWLCATLLLAQEKFVVGSPVCSQPITYPSSNEKKLFLYPNGDNVFRYITDSNNFPCIKSGEKYYYCTYKKGKAIASAYEVGTKLSANFRNKIIRHLNKQLEVIQQLHNQLKSIQLNPSVQSLGEINILLLLVEYSDKKHVTSHEEIQALFNHPGTSEVAGFKEFFQRASHGQLTINVDVINWYNCNQPHTNFSESKGMYLTGNLVRKAIDNAEAEGVDFSKYDNNGDGNADAIMVMHAGLGADHRGEEQYIWPHSWTLSGTVNKAVTYDGVKLDSYVIACERRVYNGMNKAAGIGTFAHEFGHALGLPDMYDGTGKSNGLGHWALMSAGSWLDGGYQPSNFCAWSRYNLGWEKPTEINYTDKGKYQLSSMNEMANQVVRINTKSDDQYFLIENRQAVNNDAKQPGSGLAIYQISKNKLALGRGINDNRDFPALRLLEADFSRTSGLYAAQDRGVAADLFIGDDNELVLDANSIPSTKLFDGKSSGVELSNIVKTNNDSYSFTVLGPTPTIVWNQNEFKESPLNDGSIATTIQLDLEGDEFVYDNDELAVDACQVSHLPEGLSLKLSKLNETSLSITVSGKVVNHESDDDVVDLQLSFNDTAFKTLAASAIQQSERNDLKISFLDEDKGIRLFVEDFEDVAPPALPDGWAAPNGNNGSVSQWETVVGSNHTSGGFNGMQFYDKNAANEAFWLITPLIDLQDYSEVSLLFWQKYDLNGDAKNKVAVSLDKETWTTIYDAHPEKSDVWEEATAKIPTQFKGQSIYIGFCIYEEQAWGWFWDDVSLVVDDYNAIHEIHSDKGVKLIYDDVLQTINIKASKIVKSFKFFNMAGQCVSNNHEATKISTKPLIKGVYVVQVLFDDGSSQVVKFKK